MDVFISQKISVSDGTISRELIRSFDSKIAPQINSRILDPAFLNPKGYLALEVAINYEDEECWVYIEPIKINGNDVEDLHDIINDYITRGWECPIPLR
ncbi:hypothetical protein [Paenibacillus sp. VMFN-D1]|uniref:hypothetical protein n=1 Tax=Paenibacillus sp. VMFN-D1 TaxID=2135608 RepID=UPI000E37434C|nr:hypothetical protein [Paenibacillus sp. VMFN-D1]RED32406.1 hypothetical protein C7820_5686 [Paenibacillus sp. VMFN-D1]